MIATGIPSPPLDWQVFSIQAWLLDAFGIELPFDLKIHAYALCLMLGMVAAGVITDRRLTRRGGEPGVVVDVAMWAIACGIVGARIWHVVTHPDDYFAGQDLWTVFAIWEGGIAIFGALAGGAVGAWIGCRRVGLRYTAFADALAPGMLVAQALGRLGNWFNHELYGGPTTLPWGLEIEAGNPEFPDGWPPGTLFHPAFLYEMVWNLVGVAVILLVAGEISLRRRSGVGVAGAGDAADDAVVRRVPFSHGRVFGLYLIWYGIGRFLIESIRLDPAETVLGLRSNHWAALLAVAIGVAVVVVQGRRYSEPEPSVYVPGREWVPPVADDGAAAATEGAAPEAEGAAPEAEGAAPQAADDDAPAPDRHPA